MQNLVFIPIELGIVDRFWHWRHLNDHIDLPWHYRIIVGSNLTSLVAKNGTKEKCSKLLFLIAITHYLMAEIDHRPWLFLKNNILRLYTHSTPNLLVLLKSHIFIISFNLYRVLPNTTYRQYKMKTENTISQHSTPAAPIRHMGTCFNISLKLVR